MTLSKRNFPRAAQSRRARALSLMEAVILIVILSIVGTGVGVGLQSVAHVPAGTDLRLAAHMRLVEKMEQLSTYTFTTLSANTGLSDTVTLNGVSLPRTVTVAQADADGNGVAESDYLEVTVTLNGQSLKTRVTQP